VEVQKQKKVKVKNEVKRMAETAGAEKQEPKVMAETSKKRLVQIGDKKSKANPDEGTDPVLQKEVKKKTKKRTGRASENAAEEDLGEEGEAGCSIPNRLKRPPRFGCPLLNTQTHPPLELPEDEKDTEMQSDQAGGTFENEQEPRDAPKATRDN
jgi:hypothetical protein